MQRPNPEGRTERGRRSRLRFGVIAAAALGITLASIGLATAQTDNSTSETTLTEDGNRPRSGRGHHRRSAGIHGEFTTRAPGGGYQTMTTQFGEMIEVNRSSITLRSEDGYSRTYTVDDNTMVNAGNHGIADVRQGDQVHVTAVVTDGTARAVDVRDITQSRALRERWAPRPRE